MSQTFHAPKGQIPTQNNSKKISFLDFGEANHRAAEVEAFARQIADGLDARTLEAMVDECEAAGQHGKADLLRGAAKRLAAQS